MNKIIHFAMLSAVMVLMTSCIFENTMSYPKIFAGFESFEVEGADKVEVSKDALTVDITLNELEELSAVRVKDYSLTEHAALEGDSLKVLDLTEPLYVNLTTYQNYIWTISAVQPVARYVNVDNQVGEAEFNLDERLVIVYVTEKQDLNQVTFRSAKFMREGARIISTTGSKFVDGEVVEETREVRFPMTLPCVMVRHFDVLYKGETVRWDLKVVPRSLDFKVDEVNAWTYHAQVRGIYSGNGDVRMEYASGTSADDVTEWTAVEDAVVSGVGISADIKGLEASTAYLVRVGDGEKYSETVSFKTDTPRQLPNSSFEDWFPDGKIWYPYPKGASESEKIWDSANKGSGNLIGSTTVPDEMFFVKGQGAKSAKMTSRLAVIAFAAGNLYTGHFNGLAGKGANLDWGVPFTSRPAGLKGFYKYIPTMINYADEKHQDKLDTPDKAQFQIILTDWDKPFNVITSKNQFLDIPDDPSIIAYGVGYYDKETSDFEEFYVPLEYFDTRRQPTYIVVTCCASYLGDYFTGGDGSTLWVDGLELVYE